MTKGLRRTIRNVYTQLVELPEEIALQAEMEAGTEAILKSMSPLLIAQAIAQLAGGTAFSGARLNIGSQAITTATNQDLAFTSTEDYDDGAWYDNGVSTTNVVVPAGVTRVMITGQVTWETNITGVRRLRVEVNGVVAGDIRLESTDGSQSIVQQVVAVVDVVATDVITLAAFHTRGVNLNVTQGNFTVTAIG